MHTKIAAIGALAMLMASMTAPAMATLPIVPSYDCNSSMVDTLPIVTPAQVAAIGAVNPVNVSSFCEGSLVESFGNAGGLGKAIAANPALAAALAAAGYRPDEVIGIQFGGNNSVILYVHHQANPSHEEFRSPV